MTSRAWLVAAVASVCSCAELPAIQAGSCGNGVLEAGEDCDSVAPNGAACRRADEPLSCHFDCATAKCPTGWSCGPSTGTCHQASGSFLNPPVEFDTPSGRLLLGDLDGNHVNEIVTFTTPDAAGRTSPRAFYFDDLALGPAKILPVRVPAASPNIFDLTGDGVDDLVFSSLEGLDVMAGRSDRTLTPIAFSRLSFGKGSSTRLVRVRGLRTTPTEESPVVFSETRMGRVLGGVGALNDAAIKLIAILDKSPTEILGEPLAAKLVESMPCEEILWAWKGSDAVQYAVPCNAAGGWTTSPDPMPRKLFTLPSDTIEKGVLAADLNGDHHVDLLVGGHARTWIAFGRGDGTFSADPKLGPGASVAPYTCNVTESGRASTCDFPLAASSRESTHTPAGPLLVSSTTLSWITSLDTDPLSGELVLSGFVAARKNAGAWTDARIADVNANGLLDVVASSSDSLDIDFFNGTPSFFFNPSKIATDHPVGHLAVGDFDGDLVDDIALTELEGGGPGSDSLSIAFGRFMAPPETPFITGAFEPIVQISAARIDRGDVIDGLGLIAGGQGERISVLTGNGERQLLSPYGFTNPNAGENVTAVPASIAVGNYDGDDKPDIAIFGFDLLNEPLPSTYRFWTAPGLGGGALGPAQIGPKHDAASAFASDGGAFAIVSVLRAGDLDGDGKDEVVLLAPVHLKASGALVIGKAAPGPRGPVLSVASTVPIPAGFAPNTGSDLALADIDGDGKLDAVVLDIARHNASSTLMVFFGDGKGGFEPTPSIVAIPSDSGGGVARAFAVARPPKGGGAGGSSIIAVTTQGAFHVAGGARSLAVQPLTGFTGGTSVAVGDVSGDGIDDLVVGDGRRVRIHRGAEKAR